MTRHPHPPTALSIAGSDSGGGAGIQADLRAFLSQGVFGLTAIAALTAQNTRAVTAVLQTPRRILSAQLEALFDDFPIAAVKTGMLGSRSQCRFVASEMRRRQVRLLVVDPVMVATSGARLLSEDAESAVREDLLPLARIITPNLPEAEVLLGRPIRSARQMEAAARDLLALGAGGVLLKGGHLRGREVVDLYLDAELQIELRAPRLRFSGHGTGCTLASLLAARLALGDSTEAAVRAAVAALRQGIAQGWEVGRARRLIPRP